MRTIAIPQLYCGHPAKKEPITGRRLALHGRLPPWAAGCCTVPGPGRRPRSCDQRGPGAQCAHLLCAGPQSRVSAFYRTWQPLLNEHVDAVHVMGDNALGVPGLYRFCRDHDIFFYSQLGAIKSTSENPVMRAVMDLLCRRNLAIYRKTPTYAKTPAVAAQLEQLHVPCAGVMPVGLDTAIIPMQMGKNMNCGNF